jgi:hypothetical protein
MTRVHRFFRRNETDEKGPAGPIHFGNRTHLSERLVSPAPRAGVRYEGKCWFRLAFWRRPMRRSLAGAMIAVVDVIDRDILEQSEFARTSDVEIVSL